MSDLVNKSKRKKMMAGIRSKNTRPEILIRQQLFARGLGIDIIQAGAPASYVNN